MLAAIGATPTRRVGGNVTMNLPACYLADLPEGASITGELVTEACHALARNRLPHLLPRSTDEVIHDVAAAAGLWMEPHSPFMRDAAAGLSAQSGMSVATATEGLTRVFSMLNEEGLGRWVEQDLGHPRRLDGFQATAAEQATGRRAMAVGPELLVHITAGTLPAGAVLSMVAGVLIRSAQFIKCGSGSSLVPRLFAHALRQIDPGLGSCLEIAEWPRQRLDLEEAVFALADGITATGSDEALVALRGRVPVSTSFVGHGHRVSFGYVCREVLSGRQAADAVRGVAVDVAAWNQLGCLSPHVVYVERGGSASPDEFAAALAGELGALESRLPRGSLPPADAATIRSRRSFYEVRAAHSAGTRLWTSADSTAWTVVYEEDAQFQASCLNRFVYVKPVAELEEALHGADAVRRHVSTVGLAAPTHRQSELARHLARWGGTRVCPVGRMQSPQPLWRHDGRPALGELVRWVDWET